ncbi:PaaI family thioesterase [Flavobacterium sp.]|jgi:1,4-dihydroxy-2-naphthoyl-CoA hydrolase|uniref:PaaI family thioesterase n=1 Tax=Flavobacterium sp. TaxID=239 RepID=UPI002A83C832|nr:PaaI family thioesterase [Flavobacterium sp.]
MKIQATVDQINKLCKNNLIENLGIEILKVGDDFIEASMPVDERTMTPLGFLHGGASAALAETLGSFGSYFLIDQKLETMAGLNVASNHLKGVRSGNVYAKAKITHKGRTTHFWKIEITNESGQIINSSTLTVAIIKLK